MLVPLILSLALMDQAFSYIKDNKGIDTEESYPHKAKDGKCAFKAADVGATDTGFVDIAAGHAEELTNALATVGPISVAIDASHSSFQLYKKGIYNERRCSSSRLDHGVTAVGYGSNADGDFYIVKNSWAEVWGMKGYIMMSRNKKNQCGIASSASYPTLTVCCMFNRERKAFLSSGQSPTGQNSSAGRCLKSSRRLDLLRSLVRRRVTKFRR